MGTLRNAPSGGEGGGWRTGGGIKYKPQRTAVRISRSERREASVSPAAHSRGTGVELDYIIRHGADLMVPSGEEEEEEERRMGGGVGVGGRGG